MADDYASVNVSSLKFKGEKRKKKNKSLKSSKKPTDKSGVPNERQEDAEAHGGWWKVDKLEHIKGELSIEFLPGIYAKALSSGAIILGDPHPPGEPPDDEEVFTAICASNNQIALKSGFGRYVSVNSKKRIVCISEAIGEKEMFLPVFENSDTALSTYNDYFLSPDEESEDMPIVATSTTVGAYEKLKLRVNHDPIQLEKQNELSTTDTGTLYELELGYLKKYQARGEKHVDLSQDRDTLKAKRQEGELHEALLEKRSKQKSDKYCK